MGWIKFKGISSAEFGIMEKVPVIPTAELQIKTIDIPYGTPVMFEQGYKSIKTENFVLGLKDISAEHIYDVYAWLSGAGELQTSREPDVYLKAICHNALVTKDLSRRLGKIEFSFTCDSFRYNPNNNLETLTLPETSGQKNVYAENKGNMDAFPELEITASGEWTLWINSGNYITGPKGTVSISTEYCSMKSGSTIIKVDPTFSKIILKPGQNRITVTNNVSKLKIRKNERWH